jgi:hypothetical protein
MRFGLGFYQTSEINGFTHTGHDGDIINYHSGMAFDQENGLGVLVAVNSISGMSVAKPLSSQFLQMAVMEKTGATPIPPSAEVEPAVMSADEMQNFEGFYSFAGADNLISISASEDGSLYVADFPGVPDPLQLIPLSDGSFINPLTGLRFVFEVFNGEMLLYLGEFKSILAGARLDPSTILADEKFERWIGDYYPVEPEGHVSGFTHINVDVDENGFAYLRSFSLHGLSPYSPLASIDGYNYHGGIRFGTDGEGSVWLEVEGLRLLRK